jgi:hypothetical protein
MLVTLGTAAADTSGRLTREELIAKRDAAQQRALRLQPKEKAESQAHPSQSSILDRSLILSSGRNWTFVPKGALLCVPDKFQDRVNLQEAKGKYVPFASFVTKNRGWLSTYSVTLEQARGNDAITDEVRESLIESGRVVISVCKGGPISTRPPKISEATAQN